MKSTDHPDGLLGPCMQVAIGYEQTELVNGLEGLAADPESLCSGCYMRRTVPLLVLPVPPVVLAPYEFVGRSGEGEDGAAAFAPICHTLLELIAQKGTDEGSRHCDEGRKYLAHWASSPCRLQYQQRTWGRDIAQDPQLSPGEISRRLNTRRRQS
ncbi:hypothetical protein AB0R12_21315 [Streptomyces niveus]|uniref:hypothetical protein n=1 Tax=Streptomyces niveus TaxID=193462 RepID=UPI0034283C97